MSFSRAAGSLASVGLCFSIAVHASAGRGTRAPAPLSPCAQTLSTEVVDFPIEVIYPRASIPRDVRGGPVVPRASKAFVLWRERSAPWLPDSAFLFHYFNREELVAFAVASGREIVREARAEERGRLQNELREPETAPFRLGPLRGLRVGALHSFFSLFASTVVPFLQPGRIFGGKFVIFRVGSELVVIGLSSSYYHDEIVQPVLAENPRAQFVAAGDFYVGLRGDRVQVAFQRGKGWVNVSEDRVARPGFDFETPEQVMRREFERWVPAIEQEVSRTGLRLSIEEV